VKTKSTLETLHGEGAKFFFCSCTSHALLVERWDNEICLGMWGQTGLTDYPSNLWQRLKLMWAFMRGRLFVDDIVLTLDEAKLVAEHLKELSNETTTTKTASKKLASNNRRRQQG
jgi:hypothetical protein